MVLEGCFEPLERGQDAVCRAVVGLLEVGVREVVQRVQVVERLLTLRRAFARGRGGAIVELDRLGP